jgi:hypothetical protein
VEGSAGLDASHEIAQTNLYRMQFIIYAASRILLQSPGGC